jgi:hypothetical protein
LTPWKASELGFSGRRRTHSAAAMEVIGGMLATAVFKAAAGKVSTAAGDGILQQWRFNKDLEYMRDTMKSIEAVLEDAERRSIQERSVLLWLERLTGASYDISDMFDEFEVNKSALRKVRTCLFNSLDE